MIVKAIIEERVTKYSYRIRIPLLNKAAYSANPTKTEDLNIAPVCVRPGEDVYFVKGDVVFAGFENDDLSKPVILGVLYRQDDYGSYSSLNLGSLTVNIDSYLSENTNIGKFNSEVVNQVLSSSDVLQSVISGGSGSVEEATTQDVDDAKSIFS